MVKKKKFSIEYAAKQLKRRLAKLRHGKHLEVYLDVYYEKIYVHIPNHFAELREKLPERYYGFQVIPRVTVEQYFTF